MPDSKVPNTGPAEPKSWESPGSFCLQKESEIPGQEKSEERTGTPNFLFQFPFLQHIISNRTKAIHTYVRTESPLIVSQIPTFLSPLNTPPSQRSWKSWLGYAIFVFVLSEALVWVTPVPDLSSKILNCKNASFIPEESGHSNTSGQEGFVLFNHRVSKLPKPSEFLLSVIL